MNVFFMPFMPMLLHGLITRAPYETHKEINIQRRVDDRKRAVMNKVAAERRAQQNCPKVEVLKYCFDYFTQGIESPFFVWNSNGELLHDVSINNVLSFCF